MHTSHRRNECLQFKHCEKQTENSMPISLSVIRTRRRTQTEMYQNIRTHTTTIIGHAIDAHIRQHKRQLTYGFDAKFYFFLSKFLFYQIYLKFTGDL